MIFQFNLEQPNLEINWSTFFQFQTDIWFWISADTNTSCCLALLCFNTKISPVIIISTLCYRHMLLKLFYT